MQYYLHLTVSLFNQVALVAHDFYILYQSAQMSFAYTFIANHNSYLGYFKTAIKRKCLADGISRNFGTRISNIIPSLVHSFIHSTIHWFIHAINLSMSHFYSHIFLQLKVHSYLCITIDFEIEAFNFFATFFR